MAKDAPPPFNLPGVPLPAMDPEKLTDPENRKEWTKEEEDERLSGEGRYEEKAEEEEKPQIAKDLAKHDFRVLVGIFLFVVALYVFYGFLTGGDEEEKAPGTTATTSTVQNQNQVSTTGGGGFFSSLFGGSQNVPLPLDTKVLSFYHGWVSLSAGTAGSAIYPGREYVSLTITKENLSYLDVSDWSLVNSAGQQFKLGNASNLPLRGQLNPEQKIILNAGDTIIVSSGASPLGVSFRQNACSGYLEQFQDFFPPIDQNRCPNSYYYGNGLSNDCRNYINDIPSCQTVVDFPPGVSAACQSYISNEIGYNACVRTSENSPEFLGNTWRVYLNQNAEIWKPHDMITLRDSENKIVASIKY